MADPLPKSDDTSGSPPPAAEAVVQPPATAAQQVYNDADSAFDDGLSSTVSVSDTIRNYRELHGRTFHNFGDTEYWGPNDDKQNEQLDIGHHMCTLVLDNKLYLAPLNKNIQKALDIGTGTGIWAIDFADEFPSAQVIGTDISPIQPTWIPPNLTFEIDDAQQEWTFARESFDFIHLRCLMGSIDDWPLLYERAFRTLKPGGYIEHFDMDIQSQSDDGTVGPGHTIYEWCKLFINAGEVMGRTFLIPRNAKRLIEEAGFVDVIEKVYKMPIRPWMEDEKMKEIGRWNYMYLDTGLEGMALYILKNVLGWSIEEIHVYIANMRKALKDPKNHPYYKVHVVYGRKPETPSAS